MVSVTLAVVKIHIRSGPASPWLSSKVDCCRGVAEVDFISVATCTVHYGWYWDISEHCFWWCL